ncbi:MAG: methylated-DNA--[protein]-cysteine S-methyltransferase [Aureliella sp.]
MQPPRSIVQRIESPVGPLLATWTENGLYAFEFERDENASAGQNEGLKNWKPGAAAKVEHLQKLLLTTVDRYFRDACFEWDCGTLDWSGVPEFHVEVLQSCYGIPAGQTMTYGALAEAVGRPNAARAVGGAMAKNRWPLLIPCHRVLGASGKLTGYSGVGGIETKRWLLDHERGQTQVQLV